MVLLNRNVILEFFTHLLRVKSVASRKLVGDKLYGLEHVMKNGTSHFLLAAVIVGSAAAGIGLAMQQKKIAEMTGKPVAAVAEKRVEKPAGKKTSSKTNAVAQGADSPAALVKEAKGLVKTFAGRLKKDLMTAIKSDGAASAVGVCRSSAPFITEDVTDNSGGWRVERTSLKLRNPGNRPDAFELQVLQDFARKRSEDVDPKKLVHKEIVEVDGKRVFRFMKAIPTGKVCLSCHGSQIKDDVRVQLKELYPDDEATGFSVGDIRGAFTLSKVLD